MTKGSREFAAGLLAALSSLFILVGPVLADATVQPTDDDDVNASDIRANYIKRYPYANQNDPVSNGSSQAGSSHSYQAYSMVLQPCLGGLVGAINSAVGALDSADSALMSKLGSLGGSIGNEVKSQMGQLGSFDKTNLRTQVQEGQQMTQLSSNPMGVPPYAMAAYENALSKQSALNKLVSIGAPWTGANPTVPLSALGLSTAQQNQLKQELGLSSNATSIPAMSPSLGSYSMSFVTDNKWCMAKDEYCDTFYPPLLHFFYVQFPQTASVTTASERDGDALSKGMIQTYGLPMSDTQFQVIDRNNKQRLLELMFDPERMMWKELTSDQTKLDSMSNSLGGSAGASFAQSVQQINTALINVASESAAGSTGIGKALASVQAMYKKVFMPMGVLLLLLGTVITQAKGPVCEAFGLQGDEPQPSPISGLVRAGLAVFLIPATQLIISYSIDVGNTLSAEVSNPARQWIRTDLLMKWAQQQTFHPPTSKNANAINPTSKGEGKSDNQLSSQVTQEDQSYLSGVTQLAYNGTSCVTNLALVTMTGFQLVLMCYLMLMGPIVAAFFAWPAGVGSLFRDVFSNWLQAVVTLCLWRFYWCVILAVMTQRLIYVQPNAASQWEMMMFSSFVALLLYVPFQPFSFNPGEVGAQILDKVGSTGGNAMGGAGGGAGGMSPASAGASAGGKSNAAPGETPGQAPGGPQAGQTGSSTGGGSAPAGSQRNAQSDSDDDSDDTTAQRYNVAAMSMPSFSPSINGGFSNTSGQSSRQHDDDDFSFPPPPIEGSSEIAAQAAARKVVSMTPPPPLAMPPQGDADYHPTQLMAG
ncbi:MAG TPA: hypothetical protein V6C81_04360 [Planktothrix sp.]|jgi:hypothetical protein